MEFLPAFAAGIHVLKAEPIKDVDGRNKSGHDAVSESRTRTIGIIRIGALMSSSEPTASPQLSAVTNVTVEAKDTVGAMVPGMPPVAATPYLVGIAEGACARLVKDLLEVGQITVGTRVVIDHLGPSKVGAELVIKAALVKRERNRFTFTVVIEDGGRTVARVEHERAAVSLQKIMSALG
jgi:fluoroacetyl-CoA thioesterase